MHLIVCLDEKDGMTFNGRRQTKDGAVRAAVLDMTKDAVLRMNAYSLSQFREKDAGRILCGEDCLKEAQTGEYCFTEDPDILPFAERIESITVFRWHRAYPADRYFPPILTQRRMTRQYELVGTCHERITVEVYQ